MDFLSRVIEERIRQAQSEGRFEHLRGSGQPLALNDDSQIPEDLRLAYKILRNASCLPPELELGREVASLRSLLAAATDDDRKVQLARELNLKILKLNMARKVPVSAEVGQVLVARTPGRSGSDHSGSDHSDGSRRE